MPATHLTCFSHAGLSDEGEPGERGSMWQRAQRDLWSTAGSCKPGVGVQTVTHWDLRAPWKAWDEISISAGGCTERLNTHPRSAEELGAELGNLPNNVLG